jgi:dUTP pyrophosphatase
MEIKYCKLYQDAYGFPAKMTEGSSGFDLAVYCEHCFRSKETKAVGIGIVIEIPEGYEGQIRPRSSMSMSDWMVTFGTIDSDYRGEIKVILTNNALHSRKIYKRNRIAQLIIKKIEKTRFKEVQLTELSATERGDGGFGSTGK